MPSSSSSLKPALPRLLLRASLAAGASIDAAFSVAAVAAWLGFEGFDSLLGDSVSYSRQLAAPLTARAAIQVLACYDRHRFDALIPLTALSLVVSGIVAEGGSALASSAAGALSVVGALQLILWRTTR